MYPSHFHIRLQMISFP